MALALVAVTASSALATKITPANTAIKLTQTNQAPGFVPTNAFSNTSVQCKAVSAESKTPTQVAGSLFNTNQTGTGTRSTGPGSVYMTLTPPEFKECAVYEFKEGAWKVTALTATVKTNETHGKWG